LYKNSRFWDFSRNRLTSEEIPPGDSFALYLDELPGGDEHPPSDTNQVWFDFDVLDVLG